MSLSKQCLHVYDIPGAFSEAGEFQKVAIVDAPAIDISATGVAPDGRGGLDEAESGRCGHPMPDLAVKRAANVTRRFGA